MSGTNINNLECLNNIVPEGWQQMCYFQHQGFVEFIVDEIIVSWIPIWILLCWLIYCALCGSIAMWSMRSVCSYYRALVSLALGHRTSIPRRASGYAPDYGTVATRCAIIICIYIYIYIYIMFIYLYMYICIYI